MNNTIQQNIPIIYKNRDILKELFHVENSSVNRVFFSNSDSYIGIGQAITNTECTVIFIDNAVWQYRFIDVCCRVNGYVPLEEYLNNLVEKIVNHPNYKT